MAFTAARPPVLTQRRCAALAIALALLCACPAQAQRAAGEYQVKAAFLYHFSNFVEFPARKGQRSQPIVIAIVGEDPFGTVLDETVRNKVVNGRRIVVQRVSEDNVGPCDIVFLGRSERGVARVLDSLKGQPVLTIGESDRFLRQGGMINFSLENEQVKLEINLKAAEASGLKISSKLLAVARVIGAPKTGAAR